MLYPFMVGGEKRFSEEQQSVHNPYNGKEIGRVSQAGASDIEEALQLAEKTFQITRRMHRFERADILQRLSELILRDKDQLALLIAQEAGKPILDARGEISRAIFNCRNSAEEARRLVGEEVPLDSDASVWSYQTMVSTVGNNSEKPGAHPEGRYGVGRLALARRFPIGPILAITPFNFPLNLCLHKVAPAIAAGNTVLLKPPPQTPLTSLWLGELLKEAGAPHGMISVLPCSIELSERMVLDDRVKMITFTGSAKVGWHIKKMAPMKRVTLELGGNGGVIVDETADMDFAARRCVRGGFVFAGQYCIGVQRVYAHRSIYPAFLERMLKDTEAMKVGDPLDEDTDCGPVIDRTAANRILTWVDEAVQSGAKVESGGASDGLVIKPALLTNTTPDMRVEQEEIFGPVVLVKPYDTFEGAVTSLNATEYGLQAGIFTRDVSRALGAFGEVDVGGLMINDVPIFRVDNMPFGGLKMSGVGKEGTRYAIESMTELRLLVLN